jgi:predicted ATPase
MLRWRVNMLGRFEARYGDTLLTRFESRRAVALLARLALHPRRVHPREELAELLWPETDPEVGRERLRHVLASLRRQMEPPGDASLPALFAPDRLNVAVDPAAISTDVQEFEDLVRRGRHAEALALYRGELLPGLYDDWVREERDRLTALYEEAQEGAAAQSPPTGDAEPTAAETAGTMTAPAVPHYLTTFFGREGELASLAALLEERRLVTITGPGGAGKTRLVAELARRAAPRCARTVFVPLADCAAAEQVPERLRAALRLPALPPRGERDAEPEAWEQAVAALARPGGALLVLDNFEQLVEAGGPPLVAALLERVPGLTCVVTSRRVLGLPGEQEYPVGPLPLPESESPVGDSPAVALFVDRARRTRPDFQVTERNRADLVALCRELEGMPLALELAAARVRVYPLARMRAEVAERRFALLVRTGTAAAGTKEARHASLRAAVEWSWNLLTPRRRRLLAGLSVFAGGWTAEAAADVCDAADAPEALEELVGDSLVRAEEAGDGASVRFGMLESVREFAAERLAGDAPEERAAVRRRHAAYFLRLASGNAGPAFDAEQANLTAALRNATEDGDADTALALCAALRRVWERTGVSEDVMDALRRALALPGGADGAARIAALVAGAYFSSVAGRAADARRYAAEAHARLGPPSPETAGRRSQVLWAEAQVELVHGGPDGAKRARSLLEEALALARQAGERRAVASALGLLGTVALRHEDDPEHADGLLAEAQSLLEAEGDAQRANYLRFNRANLALERDRLDAALDLYARCRRVCREIGDAALEVDVLNSTGTLYSRRSLWTEAATTLRECARRADALNYRFLLAHALWNLPEALAHTGAPRDAALLMSFAARFWTDHYGPLSDADAAHRDRVLSLAAAALPGGEDTTAVLRAEGTHLSPTEAVALALRDGA